MPGVGAYLVWPSARALAQASLTNCGVSKSGSPTPKPTTSLPAALRALALASTASVGEGATLRAQEESEARLDIVATSGKQWEEAPMARKS